MSHRQFAKIIKDSISPYGVRLTTFQLREWRPIHSELMTHRVFSRNAGSSRARPSAKIIEQVRTDPWSPIHWGKNQPGMQAHEEHTALVHVSNGEVDAMLSASDAWQEAAIQAANIAAALEKAGYHKQIVNRLLEPFTYIDVVVTATDFANWFALRDHPDAQPEIRDLARKMFNARLESNPTLLNPGEWHLPYIMPSDWKEAYVYCKKDRITRDEPTYEEKLDIVRKVSTARCARVSYKAFDGTVAPIEKDLELFERLLVSQPLHASPAEHIATPDNCEGSLWLNKHLHGNFRGWIQFRKTLPNEYVRD